MDYLNLWKMKNMTLISWLNDYEKDLAVKEEYKGYHGLYLDIRYTVNLKGS